MKKYLLFIVAVLLANVALISQSGEIMDAPGSASGTLDEAEIVVYWDVVNTSSETVSFRAKREMVETVSGSSNHFCWGGICYGPTTDVSSAGILAVIEPGATDDSFSGYYQHNGNEGCTTIRYCYYDNENPDDEVCHEITYTVNCVVGVDEFVKLEGDLGQISPNPISGTSKFTYSINAASDNSMITVYNMVGELVKEIPLNNPQGLVFVDAADFESGVYFYSLVSNNQVLSTKKMVVQ